MRILASDAMPPALLQPLLGPLRAVLGYSLLINLTLLALSIFMLQVFDRVLSTARACSA